MKTINVIEMWKKIFDAGYNNKINEDDENLTFQEVYLYWKLRSNYNSASNSTIIVLDDNYTENNAFIERVWNEMKASKKHPMKFENTWDEIFSKLKK